MEIELSKVRIVHYHKYKGHDIILKSDFLTYVSGERLIMVYINILNVIQLMDTVHLIYSILNAEQNYKSFSIICNHHVKGLRGITSYIYSLKAKISENNLMGLR